MVDVLRSFAMKTHQRAMCACVCAPFEINVQRIVADATVDPCICFENPPLFSALQKHGRCASSFESFALGHRMQSRFLVCSLNIQSETKRTTYWDEN